MMVSLAACGGSAPAAESQSAASESTAAVESAVAESQAAAESTAAAESVAAESQAAESAAAHAEVLVAYFSATGTTKGVAERIAAVTGGDLYEIVPAEPYTDEDLNYNDSSTRATMEQDDKNARPEIGSEDISLEGYTTVYLGFPIWWGEEPRILDTFVEKYDFEGITVVPFCTSGGSGTWLKGERLSSSVSEDEIKSWIEGLN